MPMSKLLRLTGWSAMLLGAPVLSCQDAPTNTSAYIPHMAFDVTSIRELRESNGSYIDNPQRNSIYQAEVEPIGLILGAYDVHLFQLLENVPQWAKTTRYAISAKSDDAADAALAQLSEKDDYAEKRHMLQGMLAERFKLQIHSETRISTTYELVATARAAKLLLPVQGDLGKTIGSCTMHFSSKGVEVDSKGCPFLLNTLQQSLGTDIVDHVGLKGAYAYHLMWNPRPVSPGDEEERYPQMVDAVREQLGLVLKQTKGPVTFWVVDHMERPTAN